MKSELKAKFLNHLLSKKKDEGFTLIELLVVIIIIGILSAIALPSFLNQANKGKQSEAKQYVGTMIRSQQAFYMEKGRFATNLADMSQPIANSTTNYAYSMPTGSATHSLNLGTSTAPALRSYGGTVVLTTNATTSETNTTGVLCESNAPGTTAVAVGTYTAPNLTCGGTSSPVQ